MVRKSLVFLVVLLCVGLVFSGCAKKSVVKQEPGVKSSEEAAKLEAEKAAKEKQEREAKAREAEQAKLKEQEAREAQKKEAEKDLVTKKQPGIEGEVQESKALKDIHFEFDRYEIRPADAEILKANAAFLMKLPNRKFQVEGHCDERGTAEYNLALGERRANSVKKYLISLGVSANQVSIISYGKEMPLDPAHNEDAWSKNRRAHTVVLSK